MCYVAFLDLRRGPSRGWLRLFCLLRVLGLLSREALLLFAQRLSRLTHRSSVLKVQLLLFGRLASIRRGNLKSLLWDVWIFIWGFGNWGPIISYGASLCGLFNFRLATFPSGGGGLSFVTL